MKICRGSTRTVFLVCRWAIKIPSLASWRSFLHGLLANSFEADYSRQHSGTIDRLCPVLFSIPGGWLVIMPRAEALLEDTFLASEPFEFAVAGAVVLPVEEKADSFGVLNGRIVAVDYGTPGVLA